MLGKTLRSMTTSLALPLALAACGDDSGDPPPPPPPGDGGMTDTGTTSDAGGETRTLSMTYDMLPALGDGYEYEGWLIVDDAPVSTGRFSVDGSGNPTPASFSIPAEAADAAALFVLTIEPSVGDDPAPSATHILAGPIDSGAAALTVDHMAALGDDFSGAAGDFILATPTSTATDDEGQGIWWLVPPMPFTPGLTLPTLPEGWAYEGWVVDDGGPVSTGRFTALDAADSDGAGATAGTEGSPPFPGQDFVDPARDLTTGHMAVISVEPEPDDSPAPFQIKPLGVAIGDMLAPTTQSMTNIAADNNPTGSIVLE